MITKFWAKSNNVIVYGVSLALLTFSLKWLHFSFVVVDHAFELYIGAIAIIFTVLGIWLATKLMKREVKTVILEKEVTIVPVSEKELPINNSFDISHQMKTKLLGLSKREHEVLQLMAEGLSNQEIADRLFVSLSTIKTHSSNIFEKMDVRRRIQAIEKAKKLGLIK